MIEDIDISRIPSIHKEAWDTLSNEACDGLRGNSPCRRIDIVLGAVGYDGVPHQMRLAEVSAAAVARGRTFCGNCPILAWARVHRNRVGED